MTIGDPPSESRLSFCHRDLASSWFAYSRREILSEQSVGNWKRQFLEGGKQGLADGGRPGSNPRVRRLEDEVEELKAALGEAHVAPPQVVGFGRGIRVPLLVISPYAKSGVIDH